MRQIPIQPLKRKCSGCGDIMTITKSDYHNNYILFDGKLYHKDCYFKTKTITKKCYECKRNISFPPITAILAQPDSVFYNDHFYHAKCFIKWCHSTVRKNKMRMIALDNIDIYRKNASDCVQETFINKKQDAASIKKFIEDANTYIMNWFDGTELTAFLKDMYSISGIDQFTWSKIKDSGIPLSDLLYMWKRRKEDLYKLNQKLITKNNNHISTESLIRYDLKVLINKYGSYLKWKEQQKILANEKESEKAKMKDDHIINEIISARQHNEKSDTDTSEGGVDINALVEDIF